MISLLLVVALVALSARWRQRRVIDTFEAERQAAYTRAHKALAALAQDAVGVVDKSGAAIIAQFKQHISELGEYDRGYVESMRGTAFERFQAAYAAYTELANGRTTSVGGLTVHTQADVEAGYTTTQYLDLAAAATGFTKQMGAVKSARGMIVSQNQRLRDAICNNARLADTLTEHAARIITLAKQRENEGYRVKLVRGKVAHARGSITMANDQLSQKNFLGAGGCLANAESVLEDAEEMLMGMPIRLASYTSEASQLEQQALTASGITVPDADTQLANLRSRYDRNLFQNVGRAQAAARNAARTFDKQLATLRSHLAAYELDEAEKVIRAIKAALKQATETHERLGKIRDELAAAAQRAKEYADQVEQDINDLLEDIQGRQGLQDTHAKNAAALPDRLQQARDMIRRNPAAAMTKMKSIRNRVVQLEGWSAKAHKVAPNQ